MLRPLIGVSRAKFLTLTLVCVALAAGLAWQAGSRLDGGRTLLVLLLALCAHISVNAFNEYFDFRSGLDAMTRRTPFSGGSGTLLAAPELATTTLLLALATLAVLIAGGLWLCWQFGWALLLPGSTGVVLIYAYTEHLNRQPLACLLAPGLGFGPCMTLGATWVLGGELSAAAWVVAALVGLLSCNLLLLNQFPDLEADRTVGRRHLPITIGRPASARVYVGLMLAAALLLPLAVLAGLLPWQGLLGLLAFALAPKLARGVLAKADRPTELLPELGHNVLLCHLAPLLLLVGLLLAGPGA